jgi:hypothetical protein
VNAETRERFPRLVASLEEVVALVDEEIRRAEAQEAERQEAEARWREQSQEWLALSSPFAAADKLLELPSRPKGDLSSQIREKISAAQNLSLRWEEALGEAEDQLMRLWSEPELRSAVESMVQEIRSVRRLRAAGPGRGWRHGLRARVHQEWETLQGDVPQVRSLSPETTEEEVAPLMREMMQRFSGLMTDMTAGLAEAHQEAMAWYAAQRALLVEALGVARRLNPSVH